MEEIIMKDTDTVKDAVPSRHVIPVFAGAKLLKGYVLDDQDKLWILDVEDNFVPAPIKERTWDGGKFHGLRVGFSSQPKCDHMSLEQIITGSKAKSAEYEERYGRAMVPETRFREDVKGSYKTVVPVYTGDQVAPNFYMGAFDPILYYLKDGILTDVKDGVAAIDTFNEWMITSTIRFYRSAEDTNDVPGFNYAECVPLWRAGRYLGASELQQMVLHVPAVGNVSHSETNSQRPIWNGKPPVEASFNDTDVQTAVLYMRAAMERRGFNAHQIDFATNEFIRMCQTHQIRGYAAALAFDINGGPRWMGGMF